MRNPISSIMAGLNKAAYVYSIENYDFCRQDLHRDGFAFG
jgi:MOSC domain-containing protein YiiM